MLVVSLNDVVLYEDMYLGSSVTPYASMTIPKNKFILIIKKASTKLKQDNTFMVLIDGQVGYMTCNSVLGWCDEISST